MADRTILLVDDEEPQRRVMAGFLKKSGFDVRQAANAADAVTIAKGHPIDLVITDLRMPDTDGLELLDELHRINPEVPAILMTAFGTIRTAVEAMKRGAADYLTKPIDLDELDVLIARVLERNALLSENADLRRQVEQKYRLQGLATSNARMQEAISIAARAAATNVTILIRGESGTGKELLARAIHQASPRRKAPFVAVNVAALPDTLIESELFGHERGAFTGADRERRGRFELADGGTLMLDEIGDLPRSTQVKLLRVLQERTFERVGGTRAIVADVRIITATNRDLDEMVRAGDFREDLFYRLNVVAITLPPLRERREDIPAIAEQFLSRFVPPGGRPSTISREAMDALLKYRYPGNVRELENIVQRAVALARTPLISTGDLPAYVLGLHAEPSDSRSLPEQVARLEQRLIRDALVQAGGVQTHAARLLGISERHLRYKLRKYGLESPTGTPA